MSLPQDVSQVVYWGLSYYRRYLDALLNKKINFELGNNYMRIIQEMFNELSSDETLAFPDKIWIDIDASAEKSIEDNERHMYGPVEHHVTIMSSGDFTYR